MTGKSFLHAVFTVRRALPVFALLARSRGHASAGARTPCSFAKGEGDIRTPYVVVRLELQPPKARWPATRRVSSHERVPSNRERVDEAVSSTALMSTQRARVTRHRARPAGSTCQGRVLPRLHTTAPRGTHNHARSHGYRMLMLHASLSHCLARTLAPRASPSGAAQGEDAKAGRRHRSCSMRMLLGGLT